ncbi:MAG: agmatinase [Chloroflexi bacterium]|nr:agmatinase [Chloroflexota bacterium]
MTLESPRPEPVEGPLRPGWATFFGAPPNLDLKMLEGSIAFLGVPFDAATNDRPGSRFGPAAVRDASMRFRPLKGWYDLDRERDILPGVRLADCGDVDIRTVDLAQNFDTIAAAVRLILNARAFPVLVGGDHSITYPAVRAYGGRPLSIVHLDAHLDYTDEWRGVRFSHDNQLRRTSELPGIQHVAVLGARGIIDRPFVLKEARERGVAIVTALEIIEKGARHALSSLPDLGDYYLTLDIDVLDPSQAPGTGFPEPGGLFYYQLKEVLETVTSKGQAVGFEIVEVTPNFDPWGRTARLAARLILDFLGLALPSGPKKL